MLRAIGIDLGSTKSVVAALRRGEPQALPNREHSPFTPSTLGLGPSGELLAGGGAVPVGSDSPLAFNGLQYTAGELVALFLAGLKAEAEAALGEPVRRAVLAAPVSFGQGQLAGLQAAARLAGLFVLRVVHSPVAAALAYSVAHPSPQPRTVMVYDLGGGCLDVAVLRLFRGALTTLGLAGESWLGGADLTESIVAYLIRGLQGHRELLLDETQAAREKLRRLLGSRAEEAKVGLSIVERAHVAIAAEEIGLPVGVDQTLTRGELEELVEPRLQETLEVTERALAEAGLAAGSIEGLLLAGGSSRIPLLQALLAQRFPQARTLRGLNPLLGAAMGAALLAGMAAEVHCPTCGHSNPGEAATCRRCNGPLAGEERTACPRCFLPNGPRRHACWKCGASLRAAGRVRRARAPAARPCPRCGAAGAAGRPVCAACHLPLAEAWPGGLRCGSCGLVLPAGEPSCPACGELVGPFVGDISSQGLGIELPDGGLDVVLPKGRSLPSPAAVYRTIHTLGAGQQSIGIHLYEGERPLARDNRCWGQLQLALPEGLPPDTPVQVGFALQQDGLLAANAALGDGSGREVEARVEYLSAAEYHAR